MTDRKDLVIAVLATFLLAVTLFTVLPTSSSPRYDPWVDSNDDGKVSLEDITATLDAFGSKGSPLTKASIEYDSGWIDITDKAGQYFTLTHGLNTLDVMVDIAGKATLDGGVHQKYLGGTDFVAGWNKTYGGAEDEWVPCDCLIQTKDGGYALVVCTGGKPCLMKTDARGNMQWNRTYGEAEDVFYAYASPLVQTTDGGYAMATTRQNAGYFDFWLVRTDAFGTPLWNQTYGTAADEYLNSMIQTREGGFALVGDTRYFGAAQGYLVVTDSVGNMLWSKDYGGYTDEGISDIVQTSDGFALGARTGSYGAGDYDMWLIKTNASGDIQWYKTYGYSGGESCYALIQTFDGGYVLAGDTSYLSAGDADFWLVKTDSLGNHLWNKTYGGVNRDVPCDLVQTSEGGYALAGESRSFGAGNRDFWLVKTDTSGNMQWNKTYGGTEDDPAFSFVQTSDGGYAMAGITKSYSASYDGWLVKTDAAGNALDGFKYGLTWVDSTANTLTLFRGTDDEYWNYVRVRIWKIKQTP
jgi:hypothetical protein